MKKSVLNYRRLRLSLKYRPKLLKMILKMRECIRKRNNLLSNLKQRLKDVESKLSLKETKNDNTQSITDVTNTHLNSNKEELKRINVSTQTIEIESIISKDSIEKKDVNMIQKEKSKLEKENSNDGGWTLNNGNGDEEKSIAEQVKEAAQSAIQQSGMVYVESAGMYYDYKTGYYYNSELGLYYHTDTKCYYSYSEDKQAFEFHSYPEQRPVNPSLIAHERRKAKKQMMKRKKEDDIDNLTKNLSQDGGKDKSDKNKSKRRKTKKEKSIKENKPEENDQEMKSETENESEKIEMDDVELENNATAEKSEKNLESEELEDGECSESDSEESDGIKSDDESSDASTSTLSDDDSIAKNLPPCMRVIVRETKLPKLKVGSLFLITKDGGTIGREGEQHTILLKDHNVSRNHLDIRYDPSKRNYVVTDLGSKNGTILNGSRMTESQIISEPVEVIHGSTIQLGETKLLCHIHPGNDTCGHCEPGLLMESEEKEKHVAYTRTCSVQKQHQLELARLKNKYAPQKLSIEATAYNDRAQTRRETVGSSHHSEKTVIADLETSIAPENKGFKLLEKMGWSKGEGLGKNNQGDTEPVPLVSNEGTAGLGASGSSVTPSVIPTPKVRNTLGPATLRLASRTKMLQPPAKAFQNTLDEDSE